MLLIKVLLIKKAWMTQNFFCVSSERPHGGNIFGRSFVGRLLWHFGIQLSIIRLHFKENYLSQLKHGIMCVVRILGVDWRRKCKKKLEIYSDFTPKNEKSAFFDPVIKHLVPCFWSNDPPPKCTNWTCFQTVNTLTSPPVLYDFYPNRTI